MTLDLWMVLRAVWGENERLPSHPVPFLVSVTPLKVLAFLWPRGRVLAPLGYEIPEKEMAGGPLETGAVRKQSDRQKPGKGKFSDL